jgi:hypothetical protein
MNWNDSEARLALVERVGVREYNRLFDEHRKESTVETVNGHDLRWVDSRFGPVCMVGTTGTGFLRIEEARKYAQGLKDG